MAISLLLASAMLYVRWLTPGEPALAQWAVAFVLVAYGLFGGAMRGQIPAFMSVELANAALLGAYGLLWTGTRSFDRRAPRTVYALIAPLAWVVLVQFPPLSDSMVDRVIVISTMISVLLVLSIVQLARRRALASKPRQTLVGLLSVALLVNLGRIIFAPSQVSGGQVLLFTDPSMAWLGMVGVAMAMFICFILVLMVRERSELIYKSAALLDPLTGALNRRGFLERSLSAAMAGGPCAAMVCDLDRFKQVNDRFGHAAGDRLLALFADVLHERLRQSDVVARIGGEEFAAVLPGADLVRAREVAARVQGAFAEASSKLGLTDGAGLLVGTVSIGLAVAVLPADASADQIETGLQDLIAQADRALYGAKAAGRNRIETGEAFRSSPGTAAGAA
ncbi:GGDEF domain-containing protein [Ancylobacter mangrovi]|uniref:GGDEF domain-containing protein n=1 Tax=Ancylobacter mangrovi TaxID=2972472 RepID=UPI00216214B5|nr:GGDEF domain-containing protein [Ancylobacter mangrovi]MCS0504475.1 GGDEF domain-containing protein [Ancylobacter mangrovi]